MRRKMQPLNQLLAEQELQIGKPGGPDDRPDTGAEAADDAPDDDFGRLAEASGMNCASTAISPFPKTV